MSEPKILFLDIETLPATVVTFSLFKPVFNMDNILDHPRMGGFSYMWNGWKKARWESEFHSKGGRRGMLAKIHELLDEADIVVHYNGQSFDMPWIKGELMLEGFSPPSPVQQIDLYRALRKNSRFISGKLDYAVQRLLKDRKVEHSGIDMWIGCLQGKRRAWDEMRKYALKDTELLPPLLEKVKPWVETGFPNFALYFNREELSCTKCGSTDFHRRGYRYTNAGRYLRFRCNTCKSWFRSYSRISTTEGRN